MKTMHLRYSALIISYLYWRAFNNHALCIGYEMPSRCYSFMRNVMFWENIFVLTVCITNVVK